MCDNKMHDGTCCEEITPCPTCGSDDHLHCNGTNLGREQAFINGVCGHSDCPCTGGWLHPKLRDGQ